jgi:hypothetical protein
VKQLQTFQITQAAATATANLTPGCRYGVLIGGTFNGASIGLAFKDRAGNSVALPEPGSVASADAVAFTAAGMIGIEAITPELVITATSAGASTAIEVTVTKMED